MGGNSGFIKEVAKNISSRDEPTVAKFVNSKLREKYCSTIKLKENNWIKKSTAIGAPAPFRRAWLRTKIIVKKASNDVRFVTAMLMHKMATEFHT